MTGTTQHDVVFLALGITLKIIYGDSLKIAVRRSDVLGAVPELVGGLSVMQQLRFLQKLRVLQQRFLKKMKRLQKVLCNMLYQNALLQYILLAIMPKRTNSRIKNREPVLIGNNGDGFCILSGR